MIATPSHDAQDTKEHDQDPGAMDAAKEYLAFSVGQEEYGVDIQYVQEIRSYERPTAMALSPADYKGVIQLRGVIVPVIDLRIRLGTPSAPYNDLTMVIVLRIGNHLMGAVVDRVSDVLMLHPHHLRPVPTVGPEYATDFITALGSVEGRTISLLNIENLMLRNKSSNNESQVNNN
jgi:purine-binding chemotaxis protein CheW